MRIPIIIGGLLIVLGACGPASRGTLRHPPSQDVSVPAKITQTSYGLNRDRYDSLPIDAEKRPVYRDRLLAYLLDRVELLLRKGDDPEALKTYRQGLTLYDPTEVYRGAVRHARLARVSARLVARHSPQGDEANVLLPLCVWMTLEPDNRQLSAKFRQISRWMQETARLMKGQSRMWQRTVKVFEEVVEVWPSRLVVEDLRKAYIEQRIAIARAFHIGPTSHLRSAVSALFQTGFKVARMFLLVDRMGEALKRLQEVATDRSPDEELGVLLEKATAKSAGAKELVALADYFAQRDQRREDPARRNREVALRVCRTAQRRFPQNAEAYWCVGRLAATLRRTQLAVLSLEQAVSLKPGNREYVEQLAQQYQRRLFRLIGDEKLDEAERELRRIEKFYKTSNSQFKRPISPPLSRVYYAIGHGFYNAGRIAHAARAFEKSVAIRRSPEALVQLATIRVKQKRPDAALTFLDKAEKLSMPTPHARAYWQGRIEQLRGQALDLAGNPAGSVQAHRRAVTAWQTLQAMGLEPEDKAEAYVHEARSLFSIGEQAKGMDALDQGIDVLPDRKETYADVIALLATHGNMPEALDAYHRALGRREVSEYLKSYCSFWIVGLARRAGLPPDPLAMSHLSRLKGTAWYTELAKLINGSVSYETLRKRAKGPSNLAELYFYQADLLLARGKNEQARELWKKVIATNMMAFYEFDMAAFNLRNGAAKVSTRPIDRKQGRTEPSHATSN
jgi:tetratricopeptide (TPR) repeat protein